MRLLLVEDDPALAEALQRALGGQGQLVEHCDDGAQAAQWALSEDFDLLVLDLGLPGLDGFGVLERLRAAGRRTPVLVTTARDAVADRVQGLDLGADDYLIKPFELDEFLARVRALLRRAGGQASDIVPLGALAWHASRRQVLDGDTPLPLTARETALMEVLVQHLGAVVSKAQIGERLFDADSDAQLSAVEVYVHRLRKHLAEHGVGIRTVRGLGYLLEQPD